MRFNTHLQQQRILNQPSIMQFTYLDYVSAANGRALQEYVRQG